MTISKKCRENTDNFLRSYSIQKALSQVSGYDESQSEEISAVSGDSETASVKPFNTDLKSGQIRLLADVSRLTYVLLLRRGEDNAFITMAFSHYDFPATNEELSLERYAGCYLNVLQVWNTRSMQDETLHRSWLCGTLPESVCEDVWNFWLFLATGSPMPEHLRDKIGIPIEQDDDIRLEYMREERQPFAAIELANLKSDIEENGRNTDDWFEMDRYILPSLWSSETLSLAAADEKPNISRKCAIYGRDETLYLEYSPEENKVWIAIYDANNEHASGLDNAEIVDVKGNPLGIINGWKCVFDVGKDFDGSIGIRTADGTVYMLEAIS